MSYKTIDMPAYPRRAHFDYFRSLAYPYVGTTVNVDITALVGRIKRTSLPFFLTVCHCVARAAKPLCALFRVWLLGGRHGFKLLL